MAIKISNLQQISDQYAISNFIYSDLHLDITRKSKFLAELNSSIERVDIRLDYDESAIKNSLRNLFNTRPGQRILFPEYGLDLNTILFEPITDSNARLLGEKIVNVIAIYEPRVRVKSCNVDTFPDDQKYEVNLVIEFPVFNTIETINTTLDTKMQSFVFIGSQRNN